jgi:hypothetical protein
MDVIDVVSEVGAAFLLIFDHQVIRKVFALWRKSEEEGDCSDF